MPFAHPLVRLDQALTLGLFYPICRFRAAQTSFLPILMYHSISPRPESGVHPYFRVATSPSVFREQMAFLKDQEYKTPSLSDSLPLLRSGLPNKAAVITFDDGFRNLFAEALPILLDLNIKATVYLPTAYIGDTPKCFKDQECLTWGEVREMHRAGIEFGSHTVNHPRLYGMRPAAIDRELRDSKAEIESQLGHEVTAFAYPYAFPTADKNFVRGFLDRLMSAGYKSCVTTEIGRCKPGHDPYRLARLPINSLDTPALFRAKLEGAYDWVGLPQKVCKRAKAALRGEYVGLA